MIYLNMLYAQARIKRFAEANGITLNREILRTPIESVEEFVKRRTITLEEIYNALGDSEACYWSYDELTEGPVIVYDKEVLEAYDEDEAIQVIVHEYLHYSPLSTNEGETELLSLFITMDTDCRLEDTITRKREKLTLQTLKEVYKPEVAKQMYDALHGKLHMEKIKEWLT